MPSQSKPARWCAVQLLVMALTLNASSLTSALNVPLTQRMSGTQSLQSSVAKPHPPHNPPTYICNHQQSASIKTADTDTATSTSTSTSTRHHCTHHNAALKPQSEDHPVSLRTLQTQRHEMNHPLMDKLMNHMESVHMRGHTSPSPSSGRLSRRSRRSRRSRQPRRRRERAPRRHRIPRVPSDIPPSVLDSPTGLHMVAQTVADSTSGHSPSSGHSSHEDGMHAMPERETPRAAFVTEEDSPEDMEEMKRNVAEVREKMGHFKDHTERHERAEATGTSERTIEPSTTEMPENEESDKMSAAMDAAMTEKRAEDEDKEEEMGATMDDLMMKKSSEMRRAEEEDGGEEEDEEEKVVITESESEPVSDAETASVRSSSAEREASDVESEESSEASASEESEDESEEVAPPDGEVASGPSGAEESETTSMELNVPFQVANEEDCRMKCAMNDECMDTIYEPANKRCIMAASTIRRRIIRAPSEEPTTEPVPPAAPDSQLVHTRVRREAGSPATPPTPPPAAPSTPPPPPLSRPHTSQMDPAAHSSHKQSGHMPGSMHPHMPGSMHSHMPHGSGGGSGHSSSSPDKSWSIKMPFLSISGSIGKGRPKMGMKKGLFKGLLEGMM